MRAVVVLIALVAVLASACSGDGGVTVDEACRSARLTPATASAKMRSMGLADDPENFVEVTAAVYTEIAKRGDGETRELFSAAARDVNQSRAGGRPFDPVGLKAVQTRCHDVWQAMTKRNPMLP